MSNLSIVSPTLRNPSFITDYAQNAISEGFNLAKVFWIVLTEDSATKSDYVDALKTHSIDGVVLNESDRVKYLADRGMEGYSWIFPKRSHAETSFGLLYSQAETRDEAVVLLDDDTQPLPGTNFFQGHLDNLKFEGETLELSSKSRWVNVLHESFRKYSLYPRGFPYSAMGSHEDSTRTRVSQVYLSQGLWTNVPDLDAVRILWDGDLKGQSRTRFDASDYGENFTVALGDYTTVCSMNLGVRRELIPGFYQFKMDDNDWGIGRFDDIWSGVVAKKILDSMNKSIINGKPLCIHNKAPRSTFKDLRSEVAGLEKNETFYCAFDGLSLEGDMYQRAESMARKLTQQHDDFLAFSGKCFLDWVELIRHVS